MNKILSNTIFYGAAIIIGSSLGTAIAFSQSTVSNQIEESKIEEISTEVEKPVENKEEKPAVLDENSWEKPAKNAERSVEKPAISVPQTSTTQVAPQVQPELNSEEEIWVYYMDEEKYLGLCPSQLPSEARNIASARLNAIGIISSGPNPTSPLRSLNNRIETWWDSYKQGRWGTEKKYMMATLSNIEDFDNTYANTRVAMFIDFDGLFVSWDNSWENGQTANLNTEKMLVLDQMASDGTNYLRSLETRYKAKCPND